MKKTNNIEILITGSKGQLGSELRANTVKYKNFNFYFTDKTNLDITDYRSVVNFVKKRKFNVIINCAAYTKVEQAELEPCLAKHLNFTAVSNLAKVAKKNNIKLIHISTDYVFDGCNKKPYSENDLPNPQNIYGKTKYEGEIAIQKINPPKSIILRTSWLYSKKGDNFLKKILDLSNTSKDIKVVSDQFGSPTSTKDLAEAILEIIPKINNKNVEIYHYANEGYCSWFDFASAIFEIKQLKVNLTEVKSSQLKSKVVRPMYSILNKNKIKEAYNLKIPFWKDSLSLALKN